MYHTFNSWTEIDDNNIKNNNLQSWSFVVKTIFFQILDLFISCFEQALCHSANRYVNGCLVCRLTDKINSKKKNDNLISYTCEHGEHAGVYSFLRRVLYLWSVIYTICTGQGIFNSYSKQLYQGWATYGPLAACGPLKRLMRPAGSSYFCIKFFQKLDLFYSPCHFHLNGFKQVHFSFQIKENLLKCLMLQISRL